MVVIIADSLVFSGESKVTRGTSEKPMRNVIPTRLGHTMQDDLRLMKIHRFPHAPEPPYMYVGKYTAHLYEPHLNHMFCNLWFTCGYDNIFCCEISPLSARRSISATNSHTDNKFFRSPWFGLNQSTMSYSESST